MLLAYIITTEDTRSHVNWERLILFFISGILHDNQLVVDSLSKVELTAENWWENALRFLMLKHIFALFALRDLKVENKATDLLLLVFEASSGKNSDSSIFLNHTSIQVQAIDFVSLLTQVHRPLHLWRVFSIVVSPDTVLEIEHCRLDSELSINDECEDSLLFPIDRDIGRDVVTKW